MTWPEPLTWPFMQHAFIAAGCIAVAGSAVGYFAILRRQTFATHALAHTGFAGAAGAALIGLHPLAGLFIVAFVAGLLMSTLGARLGERDVSVGMVLMFALGLGMLFLHMHDANANTAIGILFGSILGINKVQVGLTAGISLLLLIALAVLYRPLRFASINPAAARARGVPLAAINLLFMLMLATATAVAVPIIGALLCFAILVGPAATAQIWTGRIASGLVLSALLALLQTWGGLLASYYLDYPATSWIAGFSFACYFISRLCAPQLHDSLRPVRGYR